LEASFWRIVGTLVGAFTGWAALEAGGGSPYLLAVFAVLLGKYIYNFFLLFFIIINFNIL
jgi:F0F1-type ATP synthase assembly protein I